MSFRHGYQQGAIEVFYAIERFLDPTTRGSRVEFLGATDAHAHRRESTPSR